MIILAGVSINAVVGDNGIITNAIEAARLADITDIKEQIQIALINKNSGIYTKSDVKEVALEITGNDVIENEDGTYTVLTEKGNEVDLTDLFENAYIDKTPPNVKLETSINGNNLTVTVTATDASGIESYVYYLDDEKETEATGDSYEFTDLSDGSHTIKVVVTDTAGNSTEKEIAVVIDTEAPTVAIITSVDTESITVDVTAEDNDGIAYYEYYLDGVLIETSNDDNYTYEGLSSGTEYTIKVIVYDNSGNRTEIEETVATYEIITVADIKNNPEKYYGIVVSNYTVADDDLQDDLDEEGIQWKIFYADDENIYLIASSYVSVKDAPSSGADSPTYSDDNPYILYFGNVYSTYSGASSITDDNLIKWNSLFYQSYSTSTYNNMKCVAYLMDTSLWGDYTNTSYATYAIGGTTLEMWIASWNEKGYTTLYCNNVNSYGYYVGISSKPTSYRQWITSDTVDNSGYDDTLYFPLKTSVSSGSSCVAYWLASPSMFDNDSRLGNWLYIVECNGRLMEGVYTLHETGFRPVICLSSGVQLQEIEDGSYNIYQ